MQLVKILTIDGETLKVGSIIESTMIKRSGDATVASIFKDKDDYIKFVNVRVGCCYRISVHPRSITKITNKK